jgi:hypothetical protein
VSHCLLSGCCWGLVAKDRVEYDVGRHSCSVIELVVVVCFFVDVVLLTGVEHSSLSLFHLSKNHCTKNLKNKNKKSYGLG